MDFSPLIDGAVKVAGVVIVACVPIVSYRLNKWLGADLSDKQLSSFNDTVDKAIGKALAYGQAAGDSLLSNVTVKNVALSSALTFALSDAPAEIKGLGYSPADVAEIISNELANVLHVPSAAPVAPTTDAVKGAAMVAQADTTLHDVTLGAVPVAAVA